MGGWVELVADGPLCVRCIWWLLRCSLLMVPLCITLCPAGARLTTVCGAALFLVALLHTFLPIWCSFFFCWRTVRATLKFQNLTETQPSVAPTRALFVRAARRHKQ